MGLRGPKPTPTAMLKARNSRWPDRNRRNEPKPELGRPRCANWINKDAKRAYKMLARDLDRMGVLALIDGRALTRYCQLWSRWRAAETFLQTHNTWYNVKKDDKIVRVAAWPQVREAHMLADALLKLEREFGLTPSARVRLNAIPMPEADELETFLKIGG